MPGQLEGKVALVTGRRQESAGLPHWPLQSTMPKSSCQTSQLTEGRRRSREAQELPPHVSSVQILRIPDDHAYFHSRYANMTD